MIDIPGMIMVGSGDRNAGKTGFVCSLIGKFGSEHDIVGIKVTTIHESGRGCPHGNEGCGVCGELEGNFCIVEETSSESNKDTCRMLAAGAKKVYWLRVLKDHLTEGMRALLEIVGDGKIMICESNSLRNNVRSGLFFMVRDRKAKGCKPSAEAVIRYADDVVFFDGSRYDIDINSIKLIDGKWAMEMDATAVIMAGGKSRRMGQDKGMLPVGGKPVIKHIFNQLRSHFSQVIISSDDASRYGFLDVEVVADEDTGKGPLMGIASALRVSANDTNFVIACDIPQVDIPFVRRMVRASDGFDAVVPRTGACLYEPLFAVYKKSCLTAIDESIGSGQYQIIEPLKYCKVNYIDLDPGMQLRNLNTMDDYQEFVREKNNASI